MSRNNDVCKVMFLPEAAAEEEDLRVGDLANGEWGVFDYDTGLSIDAAAVVAGGAGVLTVPTNFFIAYIGDGTLGTAGEIYTSTGTHIQKKNVKYFSSNAPASAVSQVLTLSGVSLVTGQDDYGIIMDFRGNTEVYQRYGMNQASKFAVANTACVGSAGASAHGPAEIMAQFAISISRDSDQFMSLNINGTTITNASVYTASGISGKAGVWTINSVVKTEAEALANIRTGTAAMVMTVTMQSFSKMYTFCNVNAKYFKQRQIKAVPSLSGGLSGGSCTWGTFAETVAMVYEEGKGYDVQELEYLAGGFTGKPGVYRQSSLNGLPFAGAEFIAVKTTSYTIKVLSYDQYSVGGWLEYMNNQSTYFILSGTPGDTVTTHNGFPTCVLNAIAVNTGAKVITTA